MTQLAQNQVRLGSFCFKYFPKISTKDDANTGYFCDSSVIVEDFFTEKHLFIVVRSYSYHEYGILACVGSRSSSLLFNYLNWEGTPYDFSYQNYFSGTTRSQLFYPNLKNHFKRQGERGEYAWLLDGCREVGLEFPEVKEVNLDIPWEIGRV